MAEIDDKEKEALLKEIKAATLNDVKEYYSAIRDLGDLENSYMMWKTPKQKEVADALSESRSHFTPERIDAKVMKAQNDTLRKIKSLYEKIKATTKTIFAEHNLPVADEKPLDKIPADQRKKNSDEFFAQYPQNILFHSIIDDISKSDDKHRQDLLAALDADTEQLRKSYKVDAISGGIVPHGNDMIGKPETIVLAGYDHNCAFHHDIAECHEQGIKVIRAKPGVTLRNAIGQIHGNANIVLAAHGGEDGTFNWEPFSDHTYKELFEALPRTGISSVTLLSCYSGSGILEKILKSAPEGTMVIASFGPHSVGFSETGSGWFTDATKGKKNPADFYIEMLSNFSPDGYKNNVDDVNKLDKKIHYDNSPEHALPTIIGIGGRDPIVIHMDEELKSLGGKAMDEKAWQRSIDRIKKGDFKASDSEVDDVVTNIKNNIPLKDVNEKRIAYALTAAYLDESGALERKIGIAQHLLPPPTKEQAAGTTDKTPPPENKTESGEHAIFGSLKEHEKHSLNAAVKALASHNVTPANNESASHKLLAAPIKKSGNKGLVA